MIRKFLNYYGCRNFSRSKIWRNTEKSKLTAPDSTSTGRVFAKLDFVPNEYEKKLLIWSGLYKSAESIPGRISFETLEKAKSKCRIKGASLLMLVTLGFCGYHIWRGKKSVKRGDSLLKIQLEKERKIIEGK